jgi:hypothetical protein
MRAAGSSADLSGGMTTPLSDSAKGRILNAIPKRQVTFNSTDGKPLLRTASAADLARARSISGRCHRCFGRAQQVAEMDIFSGVRQLLRPVASLR